MTATVSVSGSVTVSATGIASVTLTGSASAIVNARESDHCCVRATPSPLQPSRMLARPLPMATEDCLEGLRERNRPSTAPGAGVWGRHHQRSHPPPQTTCARATTTGRGQSQTHSACCLCLAARHVSVPCRHCRRCHPTMGFLQRCAGGFPLEMEQVALGKCPCRWSAPTPLPCPCPCPCLCSSSQPPSSPPWLHLAVEGLARSWADVALAQHLRPPTAALRRRSSQSPCTTLAACSHLSARRVPTRVAPSFLGVRTWGVAPTAVPGEQNQPWTSAMSTCVHPPAPCAANPHFGDALQSRSMRGSGQRSM
eukprot:Opistho-2@58909